MTGALLPFADSPDSRAPEALLEALEGFSAFLNVVDILGVCSEGLDSGTERLPVLDSDLAGCTAIVLGEFAALVFNGPAGGNGEIPTEDATG